MPASTMIGGGWRQVIGRPIGARARETGMNPRIDRAYAGAGDLRRMQAAVSDAIESTGLRIGDLAWLMRGQTHRHLALDIRLWERGDGRLIGWTFVRANGSFNVFLAPGHADAAFIDEMLAVVDEAARA